MLLTEKTEGKISRDTLPLSKERIAKYLTDIQPLNTCGADGSDNCNVQCMWGRNCFCCTNLQL